MLLRNIQAGNFARWEGLAHRERSIAGINYLVSLCTDSSIRGFEDWDISPILGGNGAVTTNRKAIFDYWMEQVRKPAATRDNGMVRQELVDGIVNSLQAVTLQRCGALERSIESCDNSIRSLYTHIADMRAKLTRETMELEGLRERMAGDARAMAQSLTNWVANNPEYTIATREVYNSATRSHSAGLRIVRTTPVHVRWTHPLLGELRCCYGVLGVDIIPGGSYRIARCDERSRYINENVTSKLPHVYSYDLCEGNASADIHDAIKRLDIPTQVRLIYGLLETYNPNSPYITLEDLITGMEAVNLRADAEGLARVDDSRELGTEPAQELCQLHRARAARTAEPATTEAVAVGHDGAAALSPTHRAAMDAAIAAIERTQEAIGEPRIFVGTPVTIESVPVGGAA